MARLHLLPIFLQAEGQIRHIPPHIRQLQPLAGDDRRAIEGLRLLPRLALCLELRLHVTRGEIDAQRDLLEVAVGELGRDGLADAADLDQQLDLVMDVVRPVGQVEGVAVHEHGAVWLEEE